MKSKNSPCGNDAETMIARLAELSHPELAAQWKGRNGATPPKGLSRRLLLMALSYQMQALAYDGLDAKTERHLRTMVAGASNASPPRAAATLGPGARLMREWNGRTHIVDVIEKGFQWNGETYASLSAIARSITGARWSGPRFFGLRGEGS